MRKKLIKYKVGDRKKVLRMVPLLFGIMVLMTASLAVKLGGKSAKIVDYRLKAAYDSCGGWWECVNKGSATLCNNAGGYLEECTNSSGNSGNCCVPSAPTSTPSPAATNTPVPPSCQTSSVVCSNPNPDCVSECDPCENTGLLHGRTKSGDCYTSALCRGLREGPCSTYYDIVDTVNCGWCPAIGTTPVLNPTSTPFCQPYDCFSAPNATYCPNFSSTDCSNRPGTVAICDNCGGKDCSTTDCGGGVVPTSVPGGPTNTPWPTALPTTVPLSSCQITNLSPSSINCGGASQAVTITYNGTVSAAAAGQPIKLYLEKRDNSAITNGSVSPLVSTFTNTNGTFYVVDVCNAASGGSCAKTVTVNVPPGEYYFHCQVELDPGKCSGNPFCSYELGTRDCSGWQSCSASDNKTYTGYQAPNCSNVTGPSTIVLLLLA